MTLKKSSVEFDATEGLQPVAVSASRSVSFSEAFRFWVKLGFISFGGPAGQIAIMHRELVERRRWLSEERFLHALNYCMLLPGPEAQQLAIYIGWLLHRTLGGIVAGAFFVIPSVFILLVLSYIYAAYGSLQLVIGVLSGFKPVVVAVVVEAVLRIGGRALNRKAHVIIAVLAFASIYFLHIPFPLIVLVSALVGFSGAKYLPELFSASRNGKDLAVKSDRGGNVTEKPLLVLDDDAPLPKHTLPSRTRSLVILALGLVLWALPLLGLVVWRGGDSLHVQEYRFFTQAALVTFGGAYAVLAYVTQAAVGSYGWLTHAQAVDGLALAETTPGPLIMVLQFVGFISAWNNPQGLTPTASAITGAFVTTYVTFLPSFLFIFLGAPYIEKLRGNNNLRGALIGVTAAGVGVILNLAIVFGTAVVFPQGISGGINWFAALISVVAFLALYKLKVNVAWVVMAGGIIGLAKTLIF
ncbi:chromate efflux transporter [soil metagenome]